MRKIAAIAAFVVGLSVFAIPASAHDGGCYVDPSRPTRGSGSVLFTAGYNCNGFVHSQFSLFIYGQRRTPGQAWQIIGSQNWSIGPNSGQSAIYRGLVTSGYNCAKDYRLLASGAASPGGHSGSRYSDILVHTC